jgi:hypothetical protein
VRPSLCRACDSLPCGRALPCVLIFAVLGNIAVRRLLCRAWQHCRARFLCRAVGFAVRQQASPHGKYSSSRPPRSSQAHR